MLMGFLAGFFIDCVGAAPGQCPPARGGTRSWDFRNASARAFFATEWGEWAQAGSCWTATFASGIKSFAKTGSGQAMLSHDNSDNSHPPPAFLQAPTLRPSHSWTACTCSKQQEHTMHNMSSVLEPLNLPLNLDRPMIHFIARSRYADSGNMVGCNTAPTAAVCENSTF